MHFYYRPNTASTHKYTFTIAPNTINTPKYTFTIAPTQQTHKNTRLLSPNTPNKQNRRVLSPNTPNTQNRRVLSLQHNKYRCTIPHHSIFSPVHLHPNPFSLTCTISPISINIQILCPFVVRLGHISYLSFGNH
jgi:hypothetical protein